MIYDISPLISARLKVWPGDTPPSREVLCDIARGDNITLAIHERDLSRYLGPCQVVHVNAPRGGRVTLGMLGEAVTAERVLIATGTCPDPEDFNTDFAGLAPELVDWLGRRGALLVGIDTPSVDPFDSKDLPAHAACARHDLAILEGLVLRGVPAGRYELIALPLRLEGFDASPVRAVLRG
jgi:arylformamidase